MIQYMQGLCLLLLFFSASALPAQFQGVADCASSLCHASPQAFKDAGIAQNEYLTWYKHDRHRQAYLTLLAPQSRKIAANLGKAPAHERTDCLGCHSETAAIDNAGPRHRLEDGIGCETCHGPAETWLQSHTQGFQSTAEREKQGLFPSWDVQQRASLCLGCHLGDDQRHITHEIMAAGHPPLRFELDTYMASMPAHFRREQAAAIGKPRYSPLREWFAGQIAASLATLRRLDQHSSGPGWLPEYTLFDCYACHHDLTDQRWRPDRSPALSAGMLRLADQPLVLVDLWLSSQNHPLTKRWQALQSELERATQKDVNAVRLAIPPMIELLDTLNAALTSGPANSKQGLDILRMTYDKKALAGDFALAEQITMLAGVVLNARAAEGKLNGWEHAKSALDALHSSVKSSSDFNASAYQSALKNLIAAAH